MPGCLSESTAHTATPRVSETPEAAAAMRLAQLLRQRAFEDKAVSEVRKLAEAQLSPRLPSNPKPSFLLTGLPKRDLPASFSLSGLFHPHDTVDAAARTRSSETLLPAERMGCPTLLRGLPGCRSAVAPELPGAATLSAPRDPHLLDVRQSRPGALLPVALRFLPLLALQPESSPRSPEGPRLMAGPPWRPCPACVVHLPDLAGLGSSLASHRDAHVCIK